MTFYVPMSIVYKLWYKLLSLLIYNVRVLKQRILRIHPEGLHNLTCDLTMTQVQKQVEELCRESRWSARELWPNGHHCVEWSSLSEMVIIVWNGHHCVEWSSLCEMVIIVWNGHHCMKWSSLCKMVIIVWNGHHCVEWYHCVEWSLLCRMVIIVWNGHHCVKWSSLWGLLI